MTTSKIALNILRQEYKSYLNSPQQDETITNIRYNRYTAKKQFALEMDLVSFNEVEVMEGNELTEYQFVNSEKQVIDYPYDRAR
jgi:hypothetical protein